MQVNIEATLRDRVQTLFRAQLRARCSKVLREAQQNSPVKEGTLKSNWYITTDKNLPSGGFSVSKGNKDLFSGDKEKRKQAVKELAAATKARIVAIANWKIGDSIVFVNSTSYAPFQEYGTKHIKAKKMLTNAIEKEFG